MRILEDNRAVRVLEAMGREKGLQQGMEQGMEQVAINMAKDGDEYAKIARITGLSLERIMELANEIPA